MHVKKGACKSEAPQRTQRQHPSGVSALPSTAEMFLLMSWRDRRMAALCQAGLVEKFVDALVWVFWPVYLHQKGVGLASIGWIVGVYGFTWGAAQFFTGRLSDRVGRHPLNGWGMWICGAGVALMPLRDGAAWWSLSAAGAPRPSASIGFGATWAMALALLPSGLRRLLGAVGSCLLVGRNVDGSLRRRALPLG
jgi:MFS family permease